MASATVERYQQLHWSAAQWREHDIAQSTAYAGELDRRIGAAEKRRRRAHDARRLAEAPEWVDGPHTEQEIREARDAEWGAEIEVSKLVDRRAQVLAEVEQMKAAQRPEQRARGRAIARLRHAPTVRARTAGARPRERRGQRRTTRSCSSSSSGGDSSGLGSDSDPPGHAGRLVLRSRGPPRCSRAR